MGLGQLTPPGGAGQVPEEFFGDLSRTPVVTSDRWLLATSDLSPEHPGHTHGRGLGPLCHLSQIHSLILLSLSLALLTGPAPALPPTLRAALPLTLVSSFTFMCPQVSSQSLCGFRQQIKENSFLSLLPPSSSEPVILMTLDPQASLGAAVAIGPQVPKGFWMAVPPTLGTQRWTPPQTLLHLHTPQDTS